MSSNITPEQTAELRTLFNSFDTDNDGSICIQEIEDAMKASGKNPTKAEVQEFLDEVDTDRSGKIEFQEFVDFYSKKPSHN